MLPTFKKYPICVSLPKGLDAVSIVQPLINTKSGFNKMEIWKDIKDYEGRYQISNLGRVKSLERYVNCTYGKRIIRKKILKQNNSSTGYFVVMLCKNNKCKSFSVHRLTLKAFKSNPESKPCINHKNGIKTDNKVINLEWVTYKENSIHCIENGLRKIAKGIDCATSKLTESEVLEIRKKYKKNTYTARMLSNEYNISTNSINRILRRLAWKHI